MKQVIFSLFCAIGLCGFINVDIVNQNFLKTTSAKDQVVTDMDDLSEDYSSGWIKDFGNCCKKCGKPK